MSSCYSAHACCGVLLTGEGKKMFDEEYALAAARLNDDDGEDEDEDENGDEDEGDENLSYDYRVLNEMNPTVLRHIRLLVGAPLDAAFLHTGDPDDRPGGCNIEADEWVVGYSWLYLEGLVKDRFKGPGEVDCFSWVEAG